MVFAPCSWSGPSMVLVFVAKKIISIFGICEIDLYTNDRWHGINTVTLSSPRQGAGLVIVAGIDQIAWLVSAPN